MLRISLAQAKLALSLAGGNSDRRGADCRGGVIDRRPPFGIESFENRDITGRLDSKVAVITGAASGIGLRTVEVFVVEVAKIVIAERRIPEGETAWGQQRTCQ